MFYLCYSTFMFILYVCYISMTTKASLLARVGFALAMNCGRLDTASIIIMSNWFWGPDIGHV